MVGRSAQKERTRAAIVAAAHELAETGQEVTMPVIAQVARVSEATAYRYFPDLISLLHETMAGIDPVAAMAPVDDVADPVERVGHAAEVLARSVLGRSGAIRAVIAGSITAPERSARRPGYRFGLIERALEPWSAPAGAREQLVRDLAVVVSAEAVFTLVDLCGATPDEAVASVVSTARALVAYRVGR